MKGFLIVLIFIMSGCTNSIGLKLSSSPPQPKVTSGNQSIAVYQSSYCWKTKCVDYIGPEMMLKDKPKPVFAPGSEIRIVFSKPEPTELRVFRYNNGDQTEEVLRNKVISAPKKEGTYYYSISANWMSPKKEHVSLGSSDYVFVIQVK